MDENTRYDEVLMYCAKNELNGFKLIKRIKKKEEEPFGYFEYYLRSGLFLFYITNSIRSNVVDYPMNAKVFIEVRIMENYKSFVNKYNIKRIYNSAIKLLEISRNDYLDSNFIMFYVRDNDIQTYIDKIMSEAVSDCERYKNLKDDWENKIKEQERKWQEDKAVTAFNNYYNKDN